MRRDEGHANLQVLDALAHVEVAPVDVLGLGMVLGVVREVARRLVVEAQVDGRARFLARGTKRQPKVLNTGGS